MAASKFSVSDDELDEHHANIKRVSINAIFLIIGQLVSKIVGFGYFLFLARVFTLSEFGDINYVLSVLFLTHTFAECGLTRLVIRDIGQDESRLPSYISALIPLKTLLTLSAYGILFAIFWVSRSDNLLPLLLFGGASLVPLGVGTLFNVFLQAKQLMHYSSVSEVLLSMTQAGLGVLAILFIDKTPVIVFISYLGATIINMSYLGVTVHRRVSRLFCTTDFRFMMQLLRKAIPYAGIGILIALSLRVEILVLGWYGSSAEVGLYSVAAKIPEAAMFFPLMLSTSIAPVLAKIHGEYSPKLRMTYHWGLQRLLFFLLPFSIGVILCSELIITVLFTPDYRDAAPILKILFMAFPFLSLQMLNSSMLVTSSHAKRTLVLYLFNTLLQLISAIVCIRLWGVLGAALSFFASHSLGFLISHYHINKWFIRDGGALNSVRLPVLAALGMSALAYFGADRPLIQLVPAAFGAYLIIVYVGFKSSSPVSKALG